MSEITLNGYPLPLVDDYGHHPTELACTLETVKQVWPERRQLMVYQPHRFTRTRDLFSEFVDVLSTANDLMILDTYAASEEAIDGASAMALSDAINAASAEKVAFAKDVHEAVAWINDTAKADHVVMVQGAGDVSGVSDLLKSS